MLQGMARLFIRLDLGPGAQIGPGKVALLEEIARTGSISAAGRALRMSYRRAWMLVEELNRLFRSPVVVAQPGGAGGGGATLTAFGANLARHYRAIEAGAANAAARRLAELERALASAPSPCPPSRPTP
jgi:molybdate transport system regulatory protein